MLSDLELVDAAAILPHTPPFPAQANTLRRMIADGRHPRPTLRIGKRRYWDAALISDYRHALLVTGDQREATRWAEARAAERAAELATRVSRA